MITFCNLCQIFGYFVGNGVALHLRDFLSFFQSELSVISKLIYICIYIYIYIKSVGSIEISPEGHVWVRVALARFPSTARRER